MKILLGAVALTAMSLAAVPALARECGCAVRHHHHRHHAYVGRPAYGVGGGYAPATWNGYAYPPAYYAPYYSEPYWGPSFYVGFGPYWRGGYWGGGYYGHAWGGRGWRGGGFGGRRGR